MPSDRPTDVVHSAALRRVAPAPSPVTISFAHAPDGTVTASCRGLTGTGRTEEDALLDLQRKRSEAGPAA